MSWTKEKATQYKNDWNTQKYDQVRLNVPKGQKEIMQAYAQKNGMSLNSYINKLITDDMGEQLTEPLQQEN